MPATAIATITVTRAATSTITRIELVAERRGDVTVLALLRGGDLLRPRPLPRAGSVARVALVQASASLLSGDRLELDIVLGPGAAVELVEVAATLAQPTRGGPAAELDVAVALGTGARLHWDARPLVLAGGCDLRRRIDVTLSESAVALLRDTLVFGRAGEQPGHFVTRTTVAVDGLALHDEGFDTCDRAALRSPAVLGDARALDVAALYGRRGEASGVLQLGGPGTIAMACATDAAHAHSLIDPIHRRWERLLRDDAIGEADPNALDERHGNGLQLALPPR